METVPRPGKGVPLKKDKLQAKRKVKDLDEKGVLAWGRGAEYQMAFDLPVETAAVLGGRDRSHRRRSLSRAPSQKEEESGAPPPEAEERSQLEEVLEL